GNEIGAEAEAKRAIFEFLERNGTGGQS
ncbi:unnamed protein product, partial [Adineta steineri]